MAISTAVGNFVPGFPVNRDPRNKHLIPEVSVRAERILKGVAKEENSAFAMHSVYCCYYHKLKNGRPCTCRYDRLEVDVERTAEDKAIVLSDFLLNVPQLVPDGDSCPICLDTGFVGGYERTGTFSIVLDPTLAHNTTAGVRLEKSKPYVFRPSNVSGDITWTITIPTYFTNVTDVAIRWDEEPEEWSVKLDNVTLTEDLLEDSKGEEVTIKFSMTDGSNKAAGMYCIFLVFNVSDSYLISSNFPNIETTLTGDMNIVNDITSPQSVYFDDAVGDCLTTDLFLDTRWNKLWRVVSLETNAPYENIIDRKTQSRIVRDFEKHLMIPNKLLVGYYNKISDYYTFVI